MWQGRIIWIIIILTHIYIYIDIHIPNIATMFMGTVYWAVAPPSINIFLPQSSYDIFQSWWFESYIYNFATLIPYPWMCSWFPSPSRDAEKHPYLEIHHTYNILCKYVYSMLYNTIDNVYHINMNKAHVHEHTYIHRSVIYLLKSVAFFFFCFWTQT